MAAAAAGGGGAADSTAAAAGPIAITVSPAFKNLVKILAGMFYAGPCPPAWWTDAAEPKKDAPDPELAMFQQEKKAAQLQREAKRKAQQDTTGLGIIILSSLTEEQWVEEDEFARKLHLPPKVVRKAMRFLEQEQVVQREHRKESVRHRKQERELQIKAGLRPAPGSSSAAAAGAAAAGLPPEDEDEAIVSKGLVITYCSLDYPRLLDSVRWRLETMKKNLQQELKSNHAEQKYKCPQRQCGKEFTSMDIWQLVTPGRKGEEPRCSICGTGVVMVLDEGGTVLGTLEDKRERQRKSRALLECMDTALAPLKAQLSAVTSIPAPDFNTYSHWLHHAAAMKQRYDAIEAGQGQGGRAGKKQRVVETFSVENTEVVIKFDDDSKEADRDGAGPAHAASTATLGMPAAAAAAAAAAGASAAGGAGARTVQGPTGSKPLPPWLAKNLPSQQQQAQAVTPPWLMSQQQPAAGGQQPGFGLELKAEGGLLKAAADPAELLKAEGGGIKLDPLGLTQKQDPGVVGLQDDEDDNWEDVPGAGGASASGDAGAGGDSQGGGSLGAILNPGLDEEEDWEDV